MNVLMSLTLTLKLHVFFWTQSHGVVCTCIYVGNVAMMGLEKLNVRESVGFCGSMLLV